MARLAMARPPRTSIDDVGPPGPPSERSTASGWSTATSASKSPLRAAAKNASTTAR